TAINNANLGVTATIINDGSSSPYRLSLTSNTTGAASSMKISVNGDAALSNLLSNDPAGTQNLTQSVNAQNSALTINGIPITSANNTVSGAIQGVTLNLSQVGTTSVAIGKNSTSVQSAVSALVTAYNTLNSTLNAATAYNATTQTAGPLIGDSGIQTIRAQLRQLIGTPVAGASQNLNSLGQLGITFQNDGSMSLNTSTLQSALTNNFSSVGALFSAIGTTSDSLVGFNTSTAATQPGTYAVDITQLATQGTEVGSAAPGLTITGGSNDQLSLLIDGVNTSVTLTAGTYTQTSLAAEIQTAINGSTAISNEGSSVVVTVNSSGALSITSQRYGSASSVSLGGDAASTLLGSAPTSTAGLDVAGTIGGNPAVGSGKILTGTAGSPTAGMALSINGGTTGSRGTVTFSQGYAYQLNTLLTSFLGSSGPLTVESNSLNNNITSINAQIATLNITLAAQQANYLAEFTALDTTMAQMNATQTFLTQQLSSLFSNNSSG
ncbi:MAG: flagellar filament capping protein FliD, partial [Burkholderiales bacterium]